jgi:phage shock protein E
MNEQMIGYIIVALFLGMSVFSMAKRGRAGKETARKLAAGAKVIDVRTPAEFGAGHYPEALNIPLDQLESSLDRIGAKDKPLIVYCASGMRSRRARVLLKASGFTDVTDAGALAGMPRPS